jgi:hypothetical protein
LYPVYASRLGTKPLSPADTGWIEYGYTYQPPGSWYQELDAHWAVPVVPLAPYSGIQVYYTFPGTESNAFIIQPVIQYGFNGDFGGLRWMMASWHCDAGPGCTHSTPITIAAGDAMYGTVAGSNCSNGSCVWTITSQDVTSGQRTMLTVTDTDNYYIAVGGAVEIRGGSGLGLTSCDQYPMDGVFYSGISLYDQNRSQISPTWFGAVQPATDPSCNFNVTSTATSVNLFHNPCGPNCVTASGGLTAANYCGLTGPDPQITSVTGSGGNAITLKDKCGHTGTLTLSGATASGGLTAANYCGLSGPDPQITSITGWGANGFSMTDECGKTGYIKFQ